MIERSSLGREFHNDGAAMANARSPSVALDFTDGIVRSKVLEPLRLKGTRGRTGTQGVMGPPGKHGKTGNTGPTGPRGEKREMGVPGPRGMPGSPGEPGESISAPQVTLSPAEQTRDEGENTSFYCTAGGNPRPRMEWRFNGSKLQSGSKHWIKNDGELNIEHLNYSDAGQYTCVATNIRGSHQVSGNLTIRGENVNIQISLPFLRSSKRYLNLYRFYLIAQALTLNSKCC